MLFLFYMTRVRFYLRLLHFPYVLNLTTRSSPLSHRNMLLISNGSCFISSGCALRLSQYLNAGTISKHFTHGAYY